MEISTRPKNLAKAVSFLYDSTIKYYSLDVHSLMLTVLTE